jgi:hypothetical protein
VTVGVGVSFEDLAEGNTVLQHVRVQTRRRIPVVTAVYSHSTNLGGAVERCTCFPDGVAGLPGLGKDIGCQEFGVSHSHRQCGASPTFGVAPASVGCS